MFKGSLGQPEGGWPEQIKQVILQGRESHAGKRLPPADFAKVAEKIAVEIGREPSPDEVLSYLGYRRSS